MDSIKEDWAAASGIPGKISIVLFYIVAWFFVLVNAYQAFLDPSSFGQACVFSNRSDEAAAAWLILLTRLWASAMFVLFLYVVIIGAKVWNIAIITLVLWLGTGIIFALTGSSISSISDEEAKCINSMTSVGWIFEAVLIVILLLAIVDARNRRPEGYDSMA